MAHTISKGEKFLCKKTFKMGHGTIEYTRGNEYLSEVKDCITDNGGDVNHKMANCSLSTKEFNEHFIQID